MTPETKALTKGVFPKIDHVINAAVDMAFNDHPELPRHLRASVAKRVRGHVIGYIAMTIHHRTRR